MDDTRWRLGLAAMLVLGLALATRELGTAPLEVHEAYVVETAREMHQRGSWIVPFFNARPRLQKPPLSYWVTALTGRASGHERPQARDGRVPSALAGVGILALVLWMGARRYGRGTALLAGLVLITSLGFFHYTHNARADMLYAFWATAGLAAFVASIERADRGRSTRSSALAMWACFGLGTLTKGPQVPAMFLVAFGAWAALERIGWRRALAAFRPFSGLALFLAVTIPWWIAVERAAGTAGVERAQLEGSLLRPGGFAPDYLYRLPQLLIPWAFLVPAIAVLEWKARDPGRTTRLLAMVVAVTLVAFSFGSQHRAFYVLPLAGPAVLLLAAGLARVLADGEGHPRLRRLVGWTARGVSLVAAAGAIALLAMAQRIPDLPPGTPLRAALVGLLAVSICAPVLARPLDFSSGIVGILALAALAYGSFWLLGGPGLDWTRSRDGAERFGRMAARGTPPGREVLAWDAFPDPFVYYAERPVRELTEVDQVLGRLERSPDGLVVLAKTHALDELPSPVRVEVLHRQSSYRGRDLSLVRLSLPGSRGDPPTVEGPRARAGSARESR